MNVLISHPTGNANVRAAAKGLVDAGILQEFHTSIAAFSGNALDKLGAIGPLSEIRRRGFDPSLAPLTKMWPWREVGRMVSLKAGFKNLIQHETGFFSIDAVYRSQDKRTASTLKRAQKNGLNGIYAYEDEALYSFIEAKKIGLQCLYDLPIGYWRSARTLLEAEKERWPDWMPTLTGFKDSVEKLERKDEEIRLADCIFVASTFTANTLNDFPGKLPDIKVIPYGFPTVGVTKDYDYEKGKRKLRLLFVGGLSQRKGIADLFSAVEELKDYVELTVAGQKSVAHCPALDAALAKHRWIPSIPHSEVLKLMNEHDVFVFPSLFEGFGLVITEAMSQGTPVITTERTAGPDLIEHNENGWIVSAGSTSELKTAIEYLLNNPQKIAKAGLRAMETAKLRPWDVYGQDLAEAVITHLMNKGELIF